jgi:hypothetical protein
MTHVDFYSPSDGIREEVARGRVEAAWNCKVHRFARYDALDFYCERDQTLVAVIEMKARSHPESRYPTVYLSVRKWLALTLANVGLGVPAIFLVRFTETIRWIDVRSVDARSVDIAGRFDRPDAARDREPLIHVPISDMHTLA